MILWAVLERLASKHHVTCPMCDQPVYRDSADPHRIDCQFRAFGYREVCRVKVGGGHRD